MQHIPSVDLSDFLSDDPSRRQQFIAELGQAYEDIGFVALRNHRLSDELSASLYEQVKAFFDLPEPTKKKYAIPGLAGQRGYTPFGQEHAKGRNTGDLKEFWHFGQYLEDGDSLAGEYPPNVTVEELPRFNAVGKEAYQTLEQTGRDVLRAIALYLGEPEEFFEPYVQKGNSILRPIHYPPILAAPDDAVRAAEHEDINLITLLMGASADGLEILDKQGQWIAVTALPEQIVVNVGDMLQRLSNNRLRSTTHRVVNPPKEKWGESRFSIPFFLHPRSDMPLNARLTCIDDNHPKAYADITAGAYLEERLAEIGLKS